MSQPSYKTILSNRTLWFDGESTYPSNQVGAVIRMGTAVKYVDELTPEIIQYNTIADDNEKISVKNGAMQILTNWTIPAEFTDLDPLVYIVHKHDELMCGMNASERRGREARLASELAMYVNMELLDVLSCIIYIINKLTANHIVWGVGRGSSVSSYVLYVIGAHDVDSYLYDLDIDDFLHN